MYLTTEISGFRSPREPLTDWTVPASERITVLSNKLE
jgi:hypothetical protein